MKYSGATLDEAYLWGMDLSGSMQGAGGVGGLLAVKVESVGSAGSADRYYPTYDGNGNVSEYLDSAGAVQAHYEYDPFGKITVATGAKAQDFGHRFSTKPLDAATGLYYYGYRYYDPVTGRWPSRDPIAESGGLNLYGFVANKSTNSVDILGKLEHCYYDVDFRKFPLENPGNVTQIEGLGPMLNRPIGDGTLGVTTAKLGVEVTCEEKAGP